MVGIALLQAVSVLGTLSEEDTDVIGRAKCGLAVTLLSRFGCVGFGAFAVFASQGLLGIAEFKWFGVLTTGIPFIFSYADAGAAATSQSDTAVSLTTTARLFGIALLETLPNIRTLANQQTN